ncbi:BlaI/MecI/CopY family transcriptional regulator [Actinomadura sp. 6K520]|jgi:predicted transcriptional regulator|uniref:BlaI/MecI/CopY family transcriptional regulator n=1 Tax=Actinomadura sp. 6K520 TaxID=2530364 RepID=UPI00104C296E|nr:BlaI/MecI/CopY family transcriptional regulator [Actinomadura sp. 6K520]TDE27373.1 BlaI/MecI/CopY family transcriptional regulator [Actinomadura sp. 6K520]
MAGQRFGDLEAAIMDRMWSYGRPANVREVLEDLQRERSIAYTTVMTVMDNLHKKGWLRRKRVGRAYEYEAVASREGYTAKLMREALATSDNQAAALVHFLSDLSSEESEALRAALKVVKPRDTT